MILNNKTEYPTKQQYFEACRQYLIERGYSVIIGGASVELVELHAEALHKIDCLGRDIVNDKEPTTRGEILDTAKQYITKDRAATHGNPEDSFAAIARFWNSFFISRQKSKDSPFMVLDESDVCMMMILMKCARATLNPSHLDSWIDIAGYAGCGGEMNMSQPLPI